ncbi:hypothetical protein E4U21_002314 [Claviceps maximensis]|nr:hypothetical protein E4U21_002314 [Claviceps maximensis]
MPPLAHTDFIFLALAAEKERGAVPSHQAPRDLMPLMPHVPHAPYAINASPSPSSARIVYYAYS